MRCHGVDTHQSRGRIGYVMHLPVAFKASLAPAAIPITINTGRARLRCKAAVTVAECHRSVRQIRLIRPQRATAMGSVLREMGGLRAPAWGCASGGRCNSPLSGVGALSTAPSEQQSAGNTGFARSDAHPDLRGDSASTPAD